MHSSNTTTCVSVVSSTPTPLTDSPQQSRDVEDELRDLILWLARLKGSAVSAVIMRRQGGMNNRNGAHRMITP